MYSINIIIYCFMCNSSHQIYYMPRTVHRLQKNRFYLRIIVQWKIFTRFKNTRKYILSVSVCTFLSYGCINIQYYILKMLFLTRLGILNSRARTSMH